jgi:pimeloyl-ACP methyl ester carboxylesterase
VRDKVYALLSREWAGLALAALWALPGLAALHAWPTENHALRGLLGLAVLAIGALMALASLRHLAVRARVARALPPPGRLVDVGGYRVHVLAEGEARDGRPPVVWFAGGHAAGLAIHHLHRVFRGETRSILIDRPGTGWSDTGPFPRTTAREADEVVLALERAGEKGPFVWAGHSFGGLLCANVARRRPDLVHTLVLLDPTPLETILFGPRFSAIREMQRGALVGGLAQLFGIDLTARERRRQAANPAYAKVLEAVEAVLGPEVAAARPLEARAGAHFAMASIYAELSPEGAARCAWDTVVYDGDLGDLPVLLVAPKNDVDVNSLPEVTNAAANEGQRIARRLAATRERYLAISSRSKRVVAPPGTGHNFVYEVPDWLAGVVRDVLQRKD